MRSLEFRDERSRTELCRTVIRDLADNGCNAVRDAVGSHMKPPSRSFLRRLVDSWTKTPVNKCSLAFRRLVPIRIRLR